MNIHVLIIRVEILELKFIVLCYVRGQQFLIVINNVCALQYLVKSPNGKYRRLRRSSFSYCDQGLSLDRAF